MKGDILTVEEVSPDEVTDGIYVIHANHPVLINVNKDLGQVVLTVNTKMSHILSAVDDLPHPLFRVKGIYHPVN